MQFCGCVAAHEDDLAPPSELAKVYRPVNPTVVLPRLRSRALVHLRTEEKLVPKHKVSHAGLEASIERQAGLTPVSHSRRRRRRRRRVERPRGRNACPRIRGRCRRFHTSRGGRCSPGLITACLQRRDDVRLRLAVGGRIGRPGLENGAPGHDMHGPPRLEQLRVVGPDVHQLGPVGVKLGARKEAGVRQAGQHADQRVPEEELAHLPLEVLEVHGPVDVVVDVEDLLRDAD